SAYGRRKAAETALARGRDVVVARAFNLLGPGMPPRLVVGRVQAWLAAGARPPLPLGDLGAVRDFLSVDEAVACYRLIIARGRARSTTSARGGRGSSARSCTSSCARTASIPR